MKIHCLYDELLSLSKLKPHSKNRNKHPEDQIERLCKILTYQGWRYPIKISKQTGQITSGHGRLMAAKKLKMNEVPVVYQDYESAEQEYADVQSDNAIAAWAELDLSSINLDIGELGPDFDMDLLGIRDFQLELFPEDKEKEDKVPKNVPKICNPGDMFQLGSHFLLNGDCTDKKYTDKLLSAPAEFCFTSPPYSDMREYKGGLDLSVKHLSKFLSANCKLFAVNLGIKRKDNEIDEYWIDYIAAAREYNLKFLSWNIWDRAESGSIGAQTAMFPLEHEWIFVFGNKKQLNKTIPSKHAGLLKASLRGVRESDGSLTYKDNDIPIGNYKAMGTVYRGAPEKARNFDFDHPAMFPVHLPESYILSCTNEKEIVYDPFGGSGTTLIACEKTKRSARLMEISTEYCDMIIARWEKYTGKKAELVESDEDPTPWCSYGHKTPKECDCGPIASND